MRVRIGTEYLDQYENTDIAQTIGVNELGDISTRSGGFSNKFKIPLTSNNADILNYPTDFNNTSRQPYTRLDMELIDNGAVVASGYLKFKKVDNEKNELECTFFSNNTNWINLIKDKKLRDLNLEKWEHTWDNATMKTRIDSDPTDGYCYPVIDYGIVHASQYTIKDEFMFPAMFVHTIVRSIFNEANWRIEGELLDLELYQRMIIPFSAQDFKRPTSFSESFAPYDEFTTAGFVYEDLTVDGDTPFTSNKDGTYDVIAVVYVECTVFNANDSVVLRARKNAVTIGNTPVTITGTGITKIELTVSDVSIVSGTDDIEIQFLNADPADATIVIMNNGSLTFDAGTDFTIGDTIVDMAWTLPDISQVDFIKYIFFCFGVIPQAKTTTKTLSLDLFRSLKQNVDSAVDWSSKLDLSQKISTDFTQLLNKYGSTSKMKYKADSNDTDLENYIAENEQSDGFGDGQFSIDNEFIKDLKTIYTAPFSPTFSKYTFNDEVYAATIAFLDPSDSSGATRFSLVPKIAIMTPNEDVTETTGGAVGYTTFRINSDVDSTVTMTDAPITFFAKEDVSLLYDKYDDSLAFNQIDIVNYNGLTLNEQYLCDYESVFSNMRYLKAFFTLDEVDISNLDFKIPIYIDKYKSYFYISKIKNYRGANQSTECELVKID